MKKILTFAAVLVLSVAVSPFLTGQSIAQEQSAAPTTFLGRLCSPKPYCPPTASQPAYAGAGQSNGQGDTRIVYVPYSCPPPIYVERMKRSRQATGLLSMGRQATAAGRQATAAGRQATAAGYLQEYPEMPQNFYTTRGPRDFLIPTEKFPSIGY